MQRLFFLTNGMNLNIVPGQHMSLNTTPLIAQLPSETTNSDREMKHVSMMFSQEISVEFCFDTGKI